MKQFSLEKYLENPQRKVVTRRGNPVRIICTDRKHGEDDLPIVFLEEKNGGEFLLTCRNDGRCDNYDTQYDLFFADKEDELTEFEKEVAEAYEWAKITEREDFVNEFAPKLLDLAINELRKEEQEKLGTLEMPIDVTEPYYIKGKEDAGEAKVKELVAEFEKGRQDALKDLPKWRECEFVSVYPSIADTLGNAKLYYKNHKIDIKELIEKLPKEE